MSEVFSIRLADVIAERLRNQAAANGEPVSRLAQRLLDEGLRIAAHPGIVFRNGPSGRRAALLRGPDVWQVVSLLRSLESRGDAAVQEAAEWFGTQVGAVRQALTYYGVFSSEIDAEIAANERIADLAQDSWLQQQGVLG